MNALDVQKKIGRDIAKRFAWVVMEIGGLESRVKLELQRLERVER